MEIESLEKELLEIAVETYRFNGVFERIIEKLDFEDQLKYKSQYNWFYKRVQRSLSNAGFQIPQLQGQKYDPGMPVIPINLDDFEENEELVIEQIVEPTIIKNGNIEKKGTAVLRRML